MQTETAAAAAASSRRSATAGKAKVTYRCGHTKFVDLDGKPGSDLADAKAREATRLCRECYIAELKKQSDVAAEEAMVFAAERKLPVLQFRTEPQRRWAETERHRRIVNIEAYLQRANDGDLPKVPGYSAEILKSLTLQAVRDIFRDPRASWWITERAKPIVEVLRERIHKILARRADRQQAAAQPVPAMSRGSAFSDTDIATVR